MLGITIGVGIKITQEFFGSVISGVGTIYYMITEDEDNLTDESGNLFIRD